MSKVRYQGYFKPKNPDKYVGNINQIFFRSLWELRVMEYLDKHPDIINWASEELFIPYISPVDGQPHRYFPDFVVRIKNKSGNIETLIMEVKPLAQTQPPKQGRRSKRFLQEAKTFAVNQAKFEAASKYCKERGWRFEIITENDLKLN